MPPAVDCEADPSEVEQQQQELLDGAVPGGRKGYALSKGVLATVGAVLLGAAVLAVLYVRFSAAVGAPGAAEQKTADVIQRYALEKQGLRLTQEELTAVQGNLAKSRYALAARPRSLEDDDDDDSVSADCKQMLRDVADEVFRKVIAATMEAMRLCKQDNGSQECKKATYMVDHIEDEFTAGCKTTGDVCTITDKEENGEVIEEKDICMPKECHTNPAAANAWAEANVLPRDAGSNPDKSNTTIVCGDGGSPEAEATQPDMEFKGNEEMDGKVHPEVEVWGE